MNTSHRSVPACRPSRGSMAGWSLVEGLVTLALIGVLSAGAFPALKSMTASMQLSSVTNDFLGDLLLARSEATKRGGRVVMCKSSDGETCAAAGGWEQGWIVFHDADNNATRAADEPVLQRASAAPSRMRISGNAMVARYISFHSSGATRLVGGGFQAGTITLCQEGATAREGRQVVLSSSGRPRTQKTSVAGCA